MSAPGEAPPEDPVKRETSMTAAVLLRRSLVDKQMVDTEATIRSYEERQDDTKAQIIRRRNAQAEVYAFVNKRLEENFDSIAQLETSINAAEAEGREARRRFAEEEAAARSANAKEIHAHDGEVERCDGERQALEAFAAERGGLTAHLVAVHARCELIEEERRAAERSFLGSCEADKKMLTREAAEAAAQARKVALEDAKQKLDKITRRRIGELSRMKKELALHASESAKLERANAELKSKVDALSASLRSVRRDHKDLAKRTSTRRRKERGDKELRQAEDRDAKMEHDDVVVRRRLLGHVGELGELRAGRLHRRRRLGQVAELPDGQRDGALEHARVGLVRRRLQEHGDRALLDGHGLVAGADLPEHGAEVDAGRGHGRVVGPAVLLDELHAAPQQLLRVRELAGEGLDEHAGHLLHGLHELDGVGPEALLEDRVAALVHGQRLLHALRVLLSTAVAHGHEQRRDVEVVRPGLRRAMGSRSAELSAGRRRARASRRRTRARSRSISTPR